MNIMNIIVFSLCTAVERKCRKKIESSFPQRNALIEAN